MGLTMTAKMDTWIRAQGCKKCKDTGRIECYRDADEDCPDCSPRRKLLAELDATREVLDSTEAKMCILSAGVVVERAAHRETQAKLDAAMMTIEALHNSELAKSIRAGLEDIQAGRVKSLSCIDGGCERDTLQQQLAETQAIARELAEALQETRQYSTKATAILAKYATAKGVLPAAPEAKS